MSSPKIKWPSELRPENSPIYTYNELRIEAEPALIWAWLVRAAWWPRWYANCKDLKFLSGRGPDLEPETLFSWKTFGLRVKTVVREFAPFERLAWYGEGLWGAHGYHAWVIEPAENGCRVITEETQKGLVPTLGRFYLRPGLLREHQNWLEGLAEMVKQGPPE